MVLWQYCFYEINRGKKEVVFVHTHKSNRDKMAKMKYNDAYS